MEELHHGRAVQLLTNTKAIEISLQANGHGKIGQSAAGSHVPPKLPIDIWTDRLLALSASEAGPKLLIHGNVQAQ